MTDKPEAVAWMYMHHGSMVAVSAVRYEAAVIKALGYTETPLYTRSTPSQPDASALVEALRAVKEAYGESESARIDAALMFEIADNALQAWEQSNG